MRSKLGCSKKKLNQPHYKNSYTNLNVNSYLFFDKKKHFITYFVPQKKRKYLIFCMQTLIIGGQNLI